MGTSYLCIHGHFYQPPRENPWIEAIEPQESAVPFHDWNERITAECYRPNAFARILDSAWRIDRIVNNYSQMSFDFGPTLLSWLEESAPDVYQKIIEADRESVRLFGHGNAIAQVYNHMLLPLANDRDKETQVLWGIYDFQKRFGRKPESLWLSEIAVNYPTLEVLARHATKFIILAPSQAQRVRPIAGGDRQDVSDSTIDLSQAYRCFINRERNSYIDIFFYDGPISQAVAFEGLLSSGEYFVDRLSLAIRPEMETDQIIHIATDGESYGHHHRAGEMALAYVLYVSAPLRGMSLTNYASFLEEHPPTMEVEIKPGPNGEGTAWSCAHGVGRWKEDCGCHTGAPPGWHQKWRRPLRRTFDWLRDQLAAVYEREGSRYLKDVWAARNDYIQVILDRSDGSRIDFLRRHELRNLTHEEQVTALKLLEMQRHAMLMYTSCGWFFSEISGLETVQVLKYADRAMQLARDFGYRDLEWNFMKRLERAPSNIEQYRTGRGVYEKLVRPTRVSLEKVVSHYGILSLFQEGHKDLAQSYHYNVKRLDYQRFDGKETTAALGRVIVTSQVTLETKYLVFAVIHYGGHHFRCTLAAYREELRLDDLKARFRELIDHPTEMTKLIDRRLGKEYYTLRDMFAGEKKNILALLVNRKMQEYGQLYAQIYNRDSGLIEAMVEAGLDPPQEFQIAAEYTLSRRLQSNIVAYISENKPVYYQRAKEVANLALRQKYRLNHQTDLLLEEIIEREMKLLKEGPTAERAEKIARLIDLSSRLANGTHLSKAQNAFYELLEKTFHQLTDTDLKRKLIDLAEKLNFNTTYYLEE